MKCKCGNNLFLINIIPCCDDCDQNAAWDEEGYTTDLKVIEEKGLERTHVENEGECEMDTAYGAGCYMFICNQCNHKMNLPVAEEC